MTSKWAPIVYGRTLERDFRFIAVPPDFHREWAEPFVLGTMSVAERLSGAPRWSFFQDERTCVVGVTCMARDLVGADDPMVKDIQGRPLYLFVGFAAARDQKGKLEAPLPDGSPRSLAPFADLYKHVRDQWTVKSARETTIVDPTAVSFPTTASASRDDTIDGQQLNRNPWWRASWPNTPEGRARLWQAAIGVGQPISLCLGLARQRDVIDGPFLNATALDVSAPAYVPSREAAVAAQNPASGKASRSTGSQPAYSTSSQQRAYSQEQHNWMVVVYDAWSDREWMAQFIYYLIDKGFPVTDVAGVEYWSRMAPGPVNLAIVYSRDVSWEHQARVYPSPEAAQEDPTSMVRGINATVSARDMDSYQAAEALYRVIQPKKGILKALFERDG